MGSVAGYVAPSNIPAGTPSHLGCAPTQGQTCKVSQQLPGVERDGRWMCFRLRSYLLTELLHPGLPPAGPVLSTLTIACKNNSYPRSHLKLHNRKVHDLLLLGVQGSNRCGCSKPSHVVYGKHGYHETGHEPHLCLKSCKKDKNRTSKNRLLKN